MILPNEKFWQIFRVTNGALSTAEALAIIQVTSLAPRGNYLELGTHKGKSAMAAMAGLQDGVFSLVDPEFGDAEWKKQVIDTVTSAPRTANFAIEIVADYSTNIIKNYSNLAYVMVDSGSHGDGLPMQEVKMLEDRIVSGGIIGFHDLFSQFTEVEGAYNYLIATGKYEPITIPWGEINQYVKNNNLEEGNQSWHHTELESPNFFGALKRK